VHLVGNPLPAEAADDVMFGKSAVSEWNKFVEASKPYGFSKFSDDASQDFALNYVPANIGRDELVTNLEAMTAINTAKAMKDMQANAIADQGTNMMLFSDPILSQMNEMKGYFEMYKNNYEDIVTDSMAKIKQKPCIQ
jgi:hypothetical protein